MKILSAPMPMQPTSNVPPPSNKRGVKLIERCYSRVFGLPSRAVFIVGFLVILAGPILAQPYYTMKAFGEIDGRPVMPRSINVWGQVVGSLPIAGTSYSHAFLYSHGHIKDLGTLGGPQSFASGINALGQIVGGSTLRGAPAITHAFLYSHGRMRDLGTLGGPESVAYAVNNLGEVTGMAQTRAGEDTWHAFLWSKGKMKDLGTLGGPFSVGSAINDAGEIVGTSDLPDYRLHAFVYSAHKMIDLGTVENGHSSSAQGINMWGEITGRTDLNVNAAGHTFLHTRGEMHDLGVLNSGRLSAGASINRWSQIVGTSESPVGSGAYRAVLYSGVIHDLNDLLIDSQGWTLNEAQSINDAGQIVVFGSRNLEGTHAFLLTPIAGADLRGADGGEK